jgi:hypothetical protein
VENASGFFSSFNARHLDAEQIAKTFVPSLRFTQLLALQNSLLVGARGSGKTHMLKMLQPKALNAWSHETAEDVRSSIPYWGVFIPADEAWRHQVNAASEILPKEFQDQYRLAVFTTHVQRSLVDCFLQLTIDRVTDDHGFGKVDLDRRTEVEISKAVADSWKLKPRIHSFVGLRQALVDRLAELYEALDEEELTKSLLKRCQKQPVLAVQQATFAFDSAIGRFEGRWCLMFDELEIAPVEIQRLLFQSLRSTDQKLIFKLALSPSAEAASIFREILGPSSGNDFDEISLYFEPKESQAFCEILWERLAKGTSAEHLRPAAVLGHSLFHEPESVNPYDRAGKWQVSSSSLAKKDPSYVSFLSKYKIDPNDLASAPLNLRSAVVRKIGPMVGFRDYMFKYDVQTKTVKTRNDKSKPSKLYSGWEALCLVTEGNPRWFTGIVKTLLLARDSSVSRRELSNETQYTCLVTASRKFMDYVATIPRPAREGLSGTEGGLKSLIDALVQRFRNEILKDDFSLDPVLSFQVDSVSEDVRQAIIDGLYAGAFIPVGDVERRFAFSKDLAGQRLRMTYLLAPLEILPLRSGKDRRLSTILSSSPKISVRHRSLEADTIESLQIRLFNE